MASAPLTAAAPASSAPSTISRVQRASSVTQSPYPKPPEERVSPEKRETLSDLVARERLMRSDGLSGAGQQVVERESQFPAQPAHPRATDHRDEKAQWLNPMRRQSGEDPTLAQ